MQISICKRLYVGYKRNVNNSLIVSHKFFNHRVRSTISSMFFLQRHLPTTLPLAAGWGDGGEKRSNAVTAGINQAKEDA